MTTAVFLVLEHSTVISHMATKAGTKVTAAKADKEVGLTNLNQNLIQKAAPTLRAPHFRRM